MNEMTDDEINQMVEDARGDDVHAVRARGQLRSLFEEVVDTARSYDKMFELGKRG